MHRQAVLFALQPFLTIELEKVLHYNFLKT